MALRDLPGGGPDATGLAFVELCERVKKVSNEELTTLQRFAGIDTTGRVSPAHARAVLDRHHALLADTRAGMSDVGGLGLDHGQAEYLLLPHLAPSRRLGRLLRLDALAGLG